MSTTVSSQRIWLTISHRISCETIYWGVVGTGIVVGCIVLVQLIFFPA
jgi:hypothetical protein